MKSKFFIFPILLFLFLIFLAYYLKPNFSNNLNKSSSISLSFLKAKIASPEITLIATGDVMLGRAVNAKIQTQKNFNYPFLKTADFLKNADLTVINLESPFYDNCPITTEGMIFCADKRSIEGLTYAGIDAANLANNHILNYGQKGLNQTINLLEENQIHPFGSTIFDDSEYRIINVKGVNFGFLGLNLIDKFNKTEVFNQINNLKNQVDILVISVHWGAEYRKEPSKDQVELAHQMIDNGADLIVGHHPHVVQTNEEYNGKLIIYSLGNFIFDQPWSEETKKGMVAKLTFKDKKLIKKEFLNIYIPNTYQSEIVKDTNLTN